MASKDGSARKKEECGGRRTGGALHGDWLVKRWEERNEERNARSGVMVVRKNARRAGQDGPKTNDEIFCSYRFTKMCKLLLNIKGVLKYLVYESLENALALEQLLLKVKQMCVNCKNELGWIDLHQRLLEAIQLMLDQLAESHLELP